MKQAVRLAVAVLCLSFVSVAVATAQVPFNQGAVERVVLVHILPGHFDAFYADLKANVVPVWEAQKKAGLIQGYEMLSEHYELRPEMGLGLLADVQEHGRLGRSA